MQIATRRFTAGRGWLEPLPNLDSEQTLVIVFGPAELGDAEPALSSLRAAFPTATLLGCSSAGEILGDSIHDGEMCVAVARFASTHLRTATAPIERPHASFEAGKAIGAQLRASDLRGVLVLSDGLNVNGTELVRGINSALPQGVVVSGGLAGDGTRFQHTWVLDHKGAAEGRICAVGLYGESVRVGHGSMGGWDLFGPERTVTRAKGSVLYELDGHPALQLYKKYLGEAASELPASGLLYPLALRRGAGEPPVVRTILGIDEATQSLRFAGDIPQGARAQLMHANLDRLIAGAAGAAMVTPRDGNVPESLAVAVSCFGRRLVLRDRAEEEIEAALAELPPNAGLIGFYSYGELSPHASGRCELHNQTMTLTHIWEAA